MIPSLGKGKKCGCRTGIRVTVSLRDKPRDSAGLTKTIQDLGGAIIALGTFMGESPLQSLVIFKVEGVMMDELKKAIQPLVDQFVDIRAATAE